MEMDETTKLHLFNTISNVIVLICVTLLIIFTGNWWSLLLLLLWGWVEDKEEDKEKE